MAKHYSSTRPFLKVRGSNRKYYRFRHGALHLEDEADIKAFEASLREMQPGVRSLIRTVNQDVAQQIVAAHRAAMGPAAAHGMTTAERSRQVQEATKPALEAEARAQGIQLVDPQQAMQDPSRALSEDALQEVAGQARENAEQPPQPVPPGFAFGNGEDEQSQQQDE